MKKLLFCICIFCALKSNGQDYLISFAATGASTNVSSVQVENQTSGTSLTLSGNDILHLNAITTGVNSIKDDPLSKIKIYPNPMIDYSIVQIYPPVTGNAVITILDMTGKQVVQIQSYLENCRQDFRLSGVKNGFYLVNVTGNNYQFTGNLLSNGKSNGTISIEKVNSVTQKVDEKVKKPYNKGTQATVYMDYSSGDRIKYTGISGIYKTIITDIPTGDETITFNFIACSDVENNNYTVVQIGTQVWMAENLKTTKYKDGTTSIPNVTDNVAFAALSTPAYCWYNNDESAYKETYGALYNWYAVNTGNLCPVNWHVPTDAEWTIMENYLVTNGYNYDGSTTGNKFAKALASSRGWPLNTGIGNPGNIDYPAKRNATGFTALPGGQHGNHGLLFGSVGTAGFWWSSSEYAGMAYYRNLGYDYNFIFIYYTYESTGFSVRCIKDN
jgi:uncharacterized protein (TIGR02145 family)